MYLLPFHQVAKATPTKYFEILHGCELLEIKCTGLNLNYESFIKDSPDSITNKPLRGSDHS